MMMERTGGGRLRLVKIVGSTLLLFAAGFAVFGRLGHYAPFDDEVSTAWHGRSVWERGDAFVQHGANIVAYQGGMLIKDGRNLGEPPLQFLLAAPFVGIFGDKAWAARLPFALCGLATIVLAIVWIARDCDDAASCILLYAAFITSTALWLYFRQARYYAPVIFLSTLTAYFYLHYAGRRRTLVALGAALALLLLAHYLMFLAVCAALAIDYLLFQRKRTRLSAIDWAIVLFLPALTAGWIALFRLPPTSATAGAYQGANSLWQKGILFIYLLRDMNSDELMPVALLAAAALLAFRRQETMLRRAVVALFIYVAAIALLAPTSIARSPQAETRYLVAIIPLACFISAGVVRAVWTRAPVATGILAVMAFGTTFLHLLAPARTVHIHRTPVRSTILCFAQELINPPAEPYTPVAAWVDANVAPRDSVVAFPLHCEYPLMFLQSKAIYGWQLDATKPSPLPDLPDIHFKGRSAPDYVIFFGRPPGLTEQVDPQLRALADYEVAATLPVSSKESFRPEISWRRFGAAEKFDPDTESIVIWRKK